jgi:hypothetical protein
MTARWIVLLPLTTAAACVVIHDLGSPPSSTTTVHTDAGAEAGLDAGEDAMADGPTDGCVSDAFAPGPNRALLALQPSSADGWRETIDDAQVPSCFPVLDADNPYQTGFADVCTPGGPGVTFSAASNTLACCACIGRRKSFYVRDLTRGAKDALSTTTTTLIGSWASFEITKGTPYTEPSFRIELYAGGVSDTGWEFAGFPSVNDNCGSGHNSQLVIQGARSFSVPLYLFGGHAFDQIDVVVQSYACGDTSNGVTLGDLELTWMP